MRTTALLPELDVLPREVSRALAALVQTDEFRDIRPLLARLAGGPHFTWQTGWLTANRARHVYVHMTGRPPGLLQSAAAYLGTRFVVARAEMGLLDKRRHHPFMVVLISGRRDAVA